MSLSLTSPGVLTPSALHLVRGVVSQPELDVPLTCGGLQASRLAWLQDETYALACSTNVFSFDLDVRSVHRSGGGDDLERVDDDSNVQTTAITDDYIVPVAAAVWRPTLLVTHSTHRLEVQSVAASDGRLASVDAAGRAVVTRRRMEGESNGTCGIVCAPPDAHRSPPGWAGVALGADAMVAVARAGAHSVTLYDGPVAVHSLQTRTAPVGVALPQRTPPIAVVAAGAHVHLYDARDGTTARKPSASRRVCDGGDTLRAISHSGESGVILTAGVDRAVCALDVATLAPRGRWSPCLKYEPAAVVPGPLNALTVAAAASVDNEIALGNWAGDAANGTQRSKMLSGASAVAGGRQRVCGFRADVRVVGLARAEHGTIAACSESGAVYALTVRQSS